MIVRPARDTDAAGIATAHVRSWQAAYRGILPASVLDGLSVAQRTEQWRTILARDPDAGRASYVAARDGDVVGFVSLAPSRDDDADAAGELIAIYVRPDAWGTGAGRALMHAALDWFVAAAYTEATLWVLADNARAIRFYERAGWRPDGARKTDSIGGEEVTELRYRHRISRVAY